MLRSRFTRPTSANSLVEALNSAGQLIENCKLSEAESILQFVRTKRATGLDELGVVRYFYLSARCLYLQGEYGKALIKMKAALRLSTKVEDLNFYSQEKHLLGAIRWALGQLEEAVSEYTESLAFIKKTRDNVNLYKPLNNIGLIHFAMGDLLKATLLLQDALRHAVKFNEKQDVWLCTLNLARIHCLSGKLKDADRLLNDLDVALLPEKEELKRTSVRGILYCFTLGARESRDLLKIGWAICSKRSDAREAAICLEYLGLNEYFAGNYAKAREYYDQVLAMPEPTASAVAQTLRMLTDVEIAQNNWEAAKTTAARAEIAITKISERIELGALWRAYGQIHTHDGNHAEARSFFAKSIDLLRQLGARYELALSHFDAGRSACHSLEERLEHLRQAKALFLEMEVPKRVAQVDKALTALEAQEPSAPDSNKRTLTIKSSAANQIPEIIAVSHAMIGIMKTVERIKDRDLTVLITGETGTGKDMLAEYIHFSSVRAGKPYRVVNSAALPENLLEAELFGYTKGAFSGATKDSEGLIASADGGTFCFDEIGEIPLAVQAKLLRVIDTKIVRPVGGSVDRKVDVRFIALTNRNLEQMVSEGGFRSDLYHRLGQLPIQLPPLRARREDIIPLIGSLLAKLDLSLNGEATAVQGQLHEVLTSYSWPGNVREMIAIVTRIAALRDSNGHSDIVQLLLRELDGETPEATDRRRLFLALQRHNGNKSKVAEEIGIPRTTLISQLRKLKL